MEIFYNFQCAFNITNLALCKGQIEQSTLPHFIHTGPTLDVHVPVFKMSGVLLLLRSLLLSLPSSSSTSSMRVP